MSSIVICSDNILQDETSSPKMSPAVADETSGSISHRSWTSIPKEDYLIFVNQHLPSLKFIFNILVLYDRLVGLVVSMSDY